MEDGTEAVCACEETEEDEDVAEEEDNKEEDEGEHEDGGMLAVVLSHMYTRALLARRWRLLVLVFSLDADFACAEATIAPFGCIPILHETSRIIRARRIHENNNSPIW